MHVLLPTVALAGILLAASPSLAASRTFTLDTFDRTNFSSSVSATIALGDEQSIVAEAADASALDDLRIEVVGGELRASLERDFWDFLSFGDDRVRVVITVPALSGIRASSSSEVEALGLVLDNLAVETDSSASVRLANTEIGAIRLDASSSSTIVLDGGCETANIASSSSASIEATDFRCEIVDVEATSSSTSRVFASESIKVRANSSATVDVAGRPVGIQSDVNSSASLNILN